MAEENAPNGNGKNGKKGLTAILERAQEEGKALQQRVREEVETYYKDPLKTQLWKSIFRVKHDATPRSRSLGVLTNVFLHLHPAKINRDAVRYSYTWEWVASPSICSSCSPSPACC